MPVYLINQVSQKSGTPPAFYSNGLNYGTPCRPGYGSFGGVPRQREIAYDNYVRNIDAFIAATLNKEITAVSLPAFGELDTTNIIPIQTPRVMTKAIESLTSDQLDTLCKRISGACRERSGKTEIITTTSMDISTIRNLERVTAKSHFVAPNDCVDVKGAYAYRFLSAWLAGFLMTNGYPAFSDLLQSDFTPPDITLRVASDRVRTRDDGDNEPDDDDRLMRRKFSRKSMMSWVKAQGDKKNGDKEEYNQLEDSADVDLDDAVVIAKPSPFEVNKNIGTIGAMPFLPGLVFPYFRGMTIGDSGFMNSFILDYCFRNLGSSVDACKRSFKDLREGVKSLADTEAGKEIAFLLLGVKMALQTQTRMYVVVEEEKLKGFVLLGGGFLIFDGASWHTPLAAGEVSSEARKNFSGHDAALEEIVQILNECDLAGGGMRVDIKSDTLVGPSSLIGAIADRKVSDDQKKRLNVLVRKIRFGGHYIKMSPDSVVAMVEGTFVKENMPPDSAPCFLSSIDAPIRDRCYRWLAMFGPEAPTLFNSKGVSFPLVDGKRTYDEMEADGEKTEEVIGKKCPAKFLVAQKPIMLALEDWKRISRNQAISMNLKERAGGNRCMEIKSDSERTKLWLMLWRAAANMGKEENGSKKGKAKEREVTSDVNDFASLLESFE